MNEAAFRLGQLLSIADVVHAGYCADVRKGQVPPALLGNAVLTMAQANPVKALATLGRRWKPYDSWVKSRGAAKAAELRKSDKREKGDGDWKILKAISQYQRAGEISAALQGKLPKPNDVDDVFRAELLLGYVAGLPRRPKDESNDDHQNGEDSDGEGIV